MPLIRASELAQAAARASATWAILARFHRGDPLLSRRVAWVRNAVLNCLIEPLQPFLGIAQLIPESAAPLRMILIPRSLVFE
jgi:hypothetical protein